MYEIDRIGDDTQNCEVDYNEIKRITIPGKLELNRLKLNFSEKSSHEPYLTDGKNFIMTWRGNTINNYCDELKQGEQRTYRSTLTLNRLTRGLYSGVDRFLQNPQY